MSRPTEAAGLESRIGAPRSAWLRAGADVVRTGGAMSFGWALITSQGVAAALFALVWGGLMLPRIVSVTRPALDLAYTTILLVAAWSAVLDLYLRYEGLDVAVHAAGCGLTAAVLHRVLVSWSVLPGVDAPALRRAGVGAVLTVTALGSALGLLWEVGEWLGHSFLDDRIQVGYGDTLGDLAAGAVGAMLGGALSATRSRAHAR